MYFSNNYEPWKFPSNPGKFTIYSKAEQSFWTLAVTLKVNVHGAWIRLEADGLKVTGFVVLQIISGVKCIKGWQTLFLWLGGKRVCFCRRSFMKIMREPGPWCAFEMLSFSNTVYLPVAIVTQVAVEKLTFDMRIVETNLFLFNTTIKYRSSVLFWKCKWLYVSKQNDVICSERYYNPNEVENKFRLLNGDRVKSPPPISLTFLKLTTKLREVSFVLRQAW